jgi:hypothetical protein
MTDLKLREVPVYFVDGTQASGRAEGNNAAWLCACGQALPLIGRRFPPNHPPNTVCPDCGRRYEVQPGAAGVTELSRR